MSSLVVCAGENVDSIIHTMLFSKVLSCLLMENARLILIKQSILSILKCLALLVLLPVTEVLGACDNVTNWEPINEQDYDRLVPVIIIIYSL